MRWTWSNVPIPVAYLLGLVLGVALQVFSPERLFASPWIGLALGLPLIATGIGICVWSILEARDMDIESPNRLLTGGPYAYSRNPMYVGWELMTLGIGLAANSVWILALSLPAAAFIHLVDVPREERLLEKEFGEEYLEYRDCVRRYL